MEPGNAGDDVATGPFSSWANKVTAVTVTAVVCLVVYDRWASFDSHHRFRAVVLLVSFALFPVLRILNLRKGETFAVSVAYVWLLLGTLVFGLT